MEEPLQLPDAQLELMQLVWAHGGSIMFSELWQLLTQRKKDWKTNTVLTLLTRLAERGVLEIQKQGRLNRYVALVTREAYLDAQAKSFVDKVFSGDAKHLVSALFQQKILSEGDYDELKAFWEGGGKP